MKLTICQFSKLFLLLTAFFLPNSLQSLGYSAVEKTVDENVRAIEANLTIIQQEARTTTTTTATAVISTTTTKIKTTQETKSLPTFISPPSLSIELSPASPSPQSTYEKPSTLSKALLKQKHINGNFLKSTNPLIVNTTTSGDLFAKEFINEQVTLKATINKSAQRAQHNTTFTATLATFPVVATSTSVDTPFFTTVQQVENTKPNTVTTTATTTTTTKSKKHSTTTAKEKAIKQKESIENPIKLNQAKRVTSTKIPPTSNVVLLKPPQPQYQPQLKQQQQQHLQNQSQEQQQQQKHYQQHKHEQHREESMPKLNKRNSLANSQHFMSGDHKHHQQQSQQQKYRRRFQRQQKQQQQQQQSVAVLMPSSLLDKMHVQQGFLNFVEFFQVRLKNVKVDFIRDDDFGGFVRLLENSRYSTVVKTLHTGIVDNDSTENGFIDQFVNASISHDYANMKTRRPSINDAAKIGYCSLTEELSKEFNKSVLLWPCPRMKESSNFLPSFEAISFAVKSIAAKLNWTQVDIFVGDENWGLPLAIAANLHIPFKIEIAEDIRDLKQQDKIGKAIIITAAMSDDSTLSLLSKLRELENTKVLLIDLLAASFNAENRFYKFLRQTPNNSHLLANLLLLTVLSDKYRHFLNIAYEDHGIEMVKDFRQLRRWRSMAFQGQINETLKNQHQQQQIQQKQNINLAKLWPLHLDSTMTQMLQNIILNEDNKEKMNNSVNGKLLKSISSCPYWKGNNLSVICQNIEISLRNCRNFLMSNSNNIDNNNNNNNNNNNTNNNNNNKSNISESKASGLPIGSFNETSTTELKSILENFCRMQKFALASNEGTIYRGYGHELKEKVSSLRYFIDLFNFYDFLIAKLRTAGNVSDDTLNAFSISNTSTEENLQQTEPKYDFIVLDIVRAGKMQDGAATITTANGFNRHLEIMANGNKAKNPTTPITTKTATLKNADPMQNGNASKETAGSTPEIQKQQHEQQQQNNALKWRPLLILEQHEINLKTYITHSVQPGYDDWLLVSTAQLWHCGAICWTIIAICIGMLLIIVTASVAAGIAMRNYFLRQRLSKGPNKIVLSANDFVFPVDSRRVDEGIEAMLCCWLQQLQEFGGPEVDKPDLLKGSIGSLKNLGLIIPAGTNAAGGSITATVTATNGKPGSGSGSLARHNPALLDMRARYNGDLVQLKEIQLNGSTELKTKAMDLLVMAHGLRHENINPLIGWLSDPNRTAMVFDYCSRGSLQDVLIMDEIKLDWSFRLSLLTDLVRGMRYLHSSPIRVHGALSSRNCVVDARWVLKVTDYGLPTFYEAQGLAPPQRNAKELLWTAPELLRIMKIHNNHHHHHHHNRSLATQMSDVYSFGIIMQEVVVRGEPYCMLSLSAEEIIAKIKKPPPLIRPSVSKGAAPPEAINIMRQCWAEQPDMRPDFNSVYERFKILNHGRKVNFVDTMFQMLEKYSNNLEELIRERTDQLDIERKKTEQLLNRMLPNSVAEKLKMGLAVDPEEFSDVTIYFSDIVGFTTIAAHCSPVQVVDLLNDLYTIFDATINAYNVYKVETIGDAYMVVSGLPVKIPDHAEQIATMALDLLHHSGRFNLKHLPGVPLQLRIGLHTGPCCAGVVGLTMPRYCLFGDTVNTASRMESTGSSWRIHMSQETRDRLEATGNYMIEPRGLIEIKGKGMMNTFWLLGKKGFDKPLPTPPPIGESHGLDESLIRNITLKAQANKSRNSTNPSSSQSSSLAGESVEVKVEITPPTNADICSSNLPNSYSLDSNSTNTISPNTTLCPEFPTKTPSASPQPRKMSELSPENLLNPNAFNRLPSSAGGSSSRLYKKLEEMMDLSLPYNHYKCLSPSESNLTQFYDGKYIYGASSGSGHGPHGISGGGGGTGSGGTSVHSSSMKFDSKPGSSRLLRRQFSLDREDTQKAEHHHLQQHHQYSLQATNTLALSNKISMLEIPILHDATSRSPKGTLNKVHKQNSTSIAQDLEKIEEIPLSPASSQHHSSLDSNLNRSPPSTIEGQSPPPGNVKGPMLSPPPILSAPTSPAPSRSISGLITNRNSAVLENSTTTEASTATTTASMTSSNTTPGEEVDLRQPEIVLNAEALLS